MNEPSTIADQLKRFTAKEWAIVGGIAFSGVILSGCILAVVAGAFSGDDDVEPASAEPVATTAEPPKPKPQLPKKEAIDPKDVYDGRPLAEWQTHPQWKEAREMLALTAVIELTQQEVTPLARTRALSYKLAINGFNSEVKGLTVTQSVHAGLTGTRWMREEPDLRLVAKVDEAGNGLFVVLASGKTSGPVEEPGLACISLLKGVLPDSAFAAMDDAYRTAMTRPKEPVKIDWKAGGYEGYANWGKSPDEKGKVIGGILWAVAD